MLLYPGICLLEATNVNEGRGTSLPFCTLGAPWIDGTALATAFNQSGHTGVKATSTSYIPREGNYKHETCHGIKLEISAPKEIRSVINGLLIIQLIRTMYPDHFSWRPYPTNVNPSGAFHLDRLLGISNSESLFDLPFLAFIDKIKQMTHIHDWKQQISEHLNSDESRGLLLAIDKMREILHGEKITLPEIVVVGDQSVGKSSVL
ncbi:unnamed protein product, partial [Rotaria magnacalcarata]